MCMRRQQAKPKRKRNQNKNQCGDSGNLKYAYKAIQTKERCQRGDTASFDDDRNHEAPYIDTIVETAKSSPGANQRKSLLDRPSDIAESSFTKRNKAKGNITSFPYFSNVCTGVGASVCISACLSSLSSPLPSILLNAASLSAGVSSLGSETPCSVLNSGISGA